MSCLTSFLRRRPRRVKHNSLVYNIDVRINNIERLTMTVKELIQLLTTWSESDEEVLVEVNHGDLRDVGFVKRVSEGA